MRWEGLCRPAAVLVEAGKAGRKGEFLCSRVDLVQIEPVDILSGGWELADLGEGKWLGKVLWVNPTS